MSSEITVNVSLNIRKTDSGDASKVLVNYNKSIGFRTDLTGIKGPAPGAITATTTGTQVDLSQLIRPTICAFTHMGRLDGAATNTGDYVQVGIYDPATRKFYPKDEVWPGETYIWRLSRNIQEIYVGPGTGTSAGGETARMMVLANNASQIVLIEAFEY